MVALVVTKTCLHHSTTDQLLLHMVIFCICVFCNLYFVFFCICFLYFQFFTIHFVFCTKAMVAVVTKTSLHHSTRDQLLGRGGGGTAMPLLHWHLPMQRRFDREVLALIRYCQCFATRTLWLYFYGQFSTSSQLCHCYFGTCLPTQRSFDKEGLVLLQYCIYIEYCKHFPTSTGWEHYYGNVGSLLILSSQKLLRHCQPHPDFKSWYHEYTICNGSRPKHLEPFATLFPLFQYWLSNTFIWRHQTSPRQRLQQELVDLLMPWAEGLAD